MPTVAELTRARLRSRVEAATLDAMKEPRRVRERKAQVIGAMTGTVVELGPGTGVNLPHYAPGVKVLAVEPNPNMHPRLRARAEEHAVDLEVHTVVGESVDLPDDCADGVVGTLVLCGVEDPSAVLGEVRRLLRPGGTYFFYEHVVAPAGSMTRRVQSVVKRPHRWMANGCEVDRDTAATIRAAGFAEVELDAFDQGWQGAYARHQIIGTAVA